MPEVSIATTNNISSGLSVREFGAKGDGITSDTDAIIRAIQAAVALDVRHIYFPRGVFAVPRADIPAGGYAIEVPSDFIVSGEPGARIKQTGVTGADQAYEFSVFRVLANGHDVAFRNLNFLGENDPFKLSHNNQACCIELELSQTPIRHVEIEHCAFENLFGFPIHSQGYSDLCHVTRCTVKFCANGINLNCHRSRQSFNTIIDSEGFENTGSHCTYEGNIIIRSYRCGINLGGDTGYGKINRGNVVVGNVIEEGRGGGIFLGDSCCESTVSNNTVTKCFGTGIATDFSGTGVGKRNYGNVFIGNTVTSCGGTGSANLAGLKLTGEGSHVAIGNVLRDDAVQGYSQSGALYVSSPGNTLIGNVCKSAGNNSDIVLTGGAARTRMSGNVLAGSGRMYVAGSGGTDPFTDWTPSPADLIEQSQAVGDVYPRFSRQSGGRMSWGDGRSLSDTRLYRSGVGVLKTDGFLLAKEGLGVGGSAPASAPGTVVRKLPIYDANGLPLGFVAVYDGIE